MGSVDATGAARLPGRKIRSGMPTLPARCASPSRDMGFHIVGEDEDIVFIKLLGHVGLPAGDSHLSWRFRGEFGWNGETCQKEWAWVKSKSRIAACRAVRSQAGEAAPGAVAKHPPDEIAVLVPPRVRIQALPVNGRRGARRFDRPSPFCATESAP